MMNLLEAVGLGLDDDSCGDNAEASASPAAPRLWRAPVGEPTDLAMQICQDPGCERCVARRRYHLALLNSSVILEEVYRRARN